MTWHISFTTSAEKEFAKLPLELKKLVRKYLVEKVQHNPRDYGTPLVVSTKIKLWRYRVHNYRIIAEIRDQEVTVLVIRIGKRDNVYKS